MVRFFGFIFLLLSSAILIVLPASGTTMVALSSRQESDQTVLAATPATKDQQSSSVIVAPADTARKRVSGSKDERPAEADGTLMPELPPQKSSYQLFVEQAVGKELDEFGRDLFREVPTTFAPLDAVQVNPDYTIGPGDEIQIRGWGMVDIDATLTVNRNGEIYLPKVGSINIAGVKYRDLQGYLKKAVGRVFTRFELSASISQTRSVQVYVVGHARRPGAYTLSAMSTVLNALFASGGPSVTGSMRNIELKRGRSQSHPFDLYDILINGDKSSDLTLRDGDVIYIPPVGPQGALVGDVKRPGIYEFHAGATIDDLVGWAGGFESMMPGMQKVIIEKSVDGHYQTVAELKAEPGLIRESLSRVALQPTAIVRVVAPGAAPLEVRIERAFVHVDGEAEQTGVFELQKGESLRQLLERLGGVTDDAYIFGLRLSRESVKRDQQKKIDESVDRYEQEIEANAKQRLVGRTDAAQVAMVNAELESQRALLRKLRQIRSEGRIIMNLKDFRASVQDLPDFPLEDGDTIYIPRKVSTVEVIGAVYQQNTFIYRRERDTSDYLQLAGGVSGTGDKSELYRICADGTIRSRRHSGSGGVVNPGDAIVVPEKIQRGPTFMESLKDITTILYQFGLGAAGLATLKTL